VNEKLEHDAGENIRRELRQFVIESFLPQSGLRAFKDSDSFLEKGIIDSTGILELLEFVEAQFNIKVDDDEVIPDNLDSLSQLSGFVRRKMMYARP
jgi:acyl carrier protein